MRNVRRVTLAWLAERGIVGDRYPEDYDHPCVRGVECSRGLAHVYFEDEGRVWRLRVDYHPEDWSGTNDLREWRDRPDHEFDVVEVEARVVSEWRVKE